MDSSYSSESGDNRSYASCGNFSTIDDGDDTRDGTTFPPLYLALMWLNAFITVSGNVITIVAFLSNTLIRNKPANILILNLALADLKVGLVSLPFDILWWQIGYWWMGEAVCKFWLIVDYTASSQSMTAVLLITFDRLWMVSHIHSYVKHQTRRKVLVAILLSWTFWYLHFILLATLWEPLSGVRDIDYSEDCDLAADGNLIYTLYETIGQFVVPMILLAYANVKIFTVIRKRAKTVKQVAGNDVIVAEEGSTLARPIPMKQTHGGADRRGFDNDKRGHLEADANQQEGSSSAATTRRSIQKDRKAALTLSILVGAFAVCWFPYNVVLIKESVGTVRDGTLIFVDYLLWFNSALNPVLYVITNSHFRTQLAKMFRCKVKL